MNFLEFLEQEKKKNFTNLFIWYLYTPNSRRFLFFILKILIVIKAIFKNKISFLNDLLPAFNKEKKAKLYHKIINFIKEEIQKYYCEKKFNKKECDILLFEHPVKGDDVIFHIKSIILQDSYHVKDFIKDDDYIVDAGANIGIFSIFAVQYAKNGKIFAFEPAKSTFEILKYNTSKYNNIIPLKLALGKFRGVNKIRVFKISKGVSTLLDSDVIDDFSKSFGEYKDEEIDVITLDDFIKENNIQKINFIKIDTEGYELNILEGAIETIKKFNPVIVVSAYHSPHHKIMIPQFILSINNKYKYKINKVGEEDFIFYIEK